MFTPEFETALTGVAYDKNGLFAKILRGEIPSVKVYEDENVLSFMDIFPQSRGHLLVLPKNVEARNLLDLPADAIPTLFAAAQKIAKAMEKALKPDGIIMTQFSGAEAGQTGGLSNRLGRIFLVPRLTMGFECHRTTFSLSLETIQSTTFTST